MQREGKHSLSLDPYVLRVVPGPSGLRRACYASKHASHTTQTPCSLHLILLPEQPRTLHLLHGTGEALGATY